MKKFLSVALSLLIIVSTVFVGFAGITASAEENPSLADLNDPAKWVPNPNKPAMAIDSVTEDGYAALIASSADYQSMYFEVELNKSTSYSLLFDFKSSLMIENIQIWPTKCQPASSSDGSVTYDKENYTTADRIIFLGGWDGANNYSKNIGHTDPAAWYNGNTVDFTTNGTDTSYRIFFKFNGVVNSEISTDKTFIFKNAYVKERVTAEAVAKGNGSAAASLSNGYYGDEVIYSATPNAGEEFCGWYNGNTLVSAEAEYKATLASGANVLTASFTTVNLMNISLWEKSPAGSSIQITEAVEEGFNTIKVYDISYAYFSVDMELKPSTTYQISLDFKSAYKIDCYEIWPSKCNCVPKSDGNVGPGDGYTTDDRIVINYNYFSSKTDNLNWYNDNVISFTTNATDSAYRFYIKFGGVTDAATNATKSAFFKNFTVKEKVTASVSSTGNGTATVSKTAGLYGDAVVFTATAAYGEKFLGWYKADALVSSDAVYNTTLASGTNSLVARFTTKDLMGLAVWKSSPGRPTIQITEAVEDGFNAIKLYDIYYAYFSVDMELKPSTTYRLSYDYKADYKPEYVDIWATKCGAKPKSDGNVGPGDGYTDSDKLLRKYLSSSNIDNTVWYENNVLEFTTNATDTSYQFFMKFGGFVNDDAKTTKSVYFKNVSVVDPNAKREDFEIVSEDLNGEVIADVNDLSTVETVATDNGDGTITAEVVYENNSDMLIFKGWYENDVLRSNSESYTFNISEVNSALLTAKFVNRNLLIGAGSFETYNAGESLRVSPAGEGVLPEGGSFGMWSQWPTNEEITTGYECESTNYQVDIASGEQQNLTYLSSLVWDSETNETTHTSGTVSVSPHSGKKMLRIKAPYRSMIRKIDNLKPNSNYTLSFYVWNPDRWTCLRNAVVSDSVDLKTYLLENTTSKTYAYFRGMSAVKFNPDTGLDEDIPVREWQKITLNFTTDSDDEYLYLHLGFARSGVGSTSGNVYFDDMICTEDVFANSGNAIRQSDSALRYKFAVPNEFLTKYYEGATLNKLGVLVDTDENMLLVGAARKDAEITEDNYQYVEGDSSHIYFTAALYNIGKKDGATDYSFYGKNYIVRPYAIYEKADGTQFIIYGDAVTANIFDVMYQIKYQSISDADVAIVDEMLKNEALYDAYMARQTTDYFYISKSNASDYAYSMAVIGDTQITTYKHPDMHHYAYDWIIENQQDKNIQYVFGLGDITDQNNDWEYAVAEREFKRLQAAGIDQSIVRGNHDWHFNDYITFDEYGNGLVSYDGTMRNTYRLTTIGGVKYMMLVLDLLPDDVVIEWAAAAIEAHSDYNVILTTHAYFESGMVNGNGELLQDEDIDWVSNKETANSGQDIFDKLVSKYSNIVLVMCGHASTEDYGPCYMVSERADGSKVVQMMINHQQLESVDGRSYGMLAMFYFKNDGKTVQIEFFSAVNNMYYMDKFQYEFELDLVD